MNKWNDDAGTPPRPDEEPLPFDAAFAEVLRRAVMRIGVPEEVAQQVLHESVTYSMVVGRPPDEAKAWLIGAVGLAAGRYLQLHGLAPAGDLEEATRAVERLDLNRKELATLPPVAREAVRLRVSEKWSWAEIAAELGVSQVAAKKMVEMAWVKLRKLRRERE